MLDSPKNFYLKFTSKTSPDEKIQHPSFSNKDSKTKPKFKNTTNPFKTTTSVFPRLDSSSEYIKTNLSTKILKNFGKIWILFKINKHMITINRI